MKEAEQDAQRYEGKVTNGMGNSMVKTQTKETGEFLSKVVTTVNNYLNQTTLSSMQADLPLEEEYCRDVLSTLRRMSVFCEGGAEACRLLLHHEPFQDKRAENTLYKVYHQCIEEFFMPKKDTWFENSRAAYTGNSAIQFYQAVPASLQELLTALSPDFLHMREELAHYEASGSNMAQIR
ncbi:DUF3907 family protein [Bacillus atrophaeus]|uniref:DUF3907 family protein n=1 Tax=Bacillus atrophaeus TaxID=1452 RepID=UPI00227FD14E|nr:DUF3907 family protein [Bacillus atrophaeus]MCY8909419.1 YpuI family protein [Bacillus atrophaeus]MCY8933492.1 YpuI family protein [Bacillus atrophaeus]MCY8941141.1 YpuI family protein [Bacillus atrophaeus]MCY8945916.1 YpuI family protein [Bacillus atrophaeus]MCY9107762.1 YpuI family protein [Bacillus atrophaeus]